MGEIKKVAVIDDDEVFQLIIKKQIEMKNIQCEILKFYNGQEAYEYLRDNADLNGNIPDLVMLDVNMPVKDGWGFLDDYDTLPDSVKTRINLYMVTSSVIQSDIDRAKNNDNIVDFVSKPITNDKLGELFGVA